MGAPRQLRVGRSGTGSRGSVGSYLRILAPTLSCRRPRACHMRPFLGPPGCPSRRVQGQMLPRHGLRPLCHRQACSAGNHPFQVPGMRPVPRRPAIPSQASFANTVGPSLTFPGVSELHLPISVLVTFALSRGHLSWTRGWIRGAKDFYFKVPEQKTACACVEVACNETKPQRIICGGKGQGDG